MNSLLPEYDMPPTAGSPPSPQATAVAAVVAVVVFFSLLLGCDSRPGSGPASPPPPPPTPEEAFERFLSELRRRVEGTAGAGAISERGASYTGGYQVVGGELLTPETSEGVFRATVEIRETASFTVITIPDETTTAESPKAAPGGDLIEGMEDLLGPEAMQKTERPSPIGPSPINTQDHTETHRYDLAFVDGRWRLKTNIPKGTFLAGAFKLALNRQ